MHGVRAGAGVPALPGQAEGIRVRRRSRSSTEYIDPDKKPTVAQAEPGPAVRHDRLQLQGAHRARHVGHRAGHHQRHHQGRAAASRRRSTSPRATARRTRPRPSATATTRSPARSAARTTPSTSSCSRRAGIGARRCGGGDRRGAEDRLLPAEIDALKKYLDKDGKLLLELDPPDKAGQPAAHQPDRARARLGHRRRQQHRRRRQRHGPADRHRRVGAGRRQLPVASDHERFSLLTAFPLARVGHAGDGRRQRTHRAALRRDEPAQLGRDRPQGAAGHRRGLARRGEGRQEGTDHARGGRVGPAAAPTAPGGRTRSTRSAEAGDARRGRWRLGLRRERPASAFRATATCS